MAEGGTSFAVVTGASSGIGLELAREFVDHGFDVLICAEDAELADAASQLAAGGNQVDVVRADLATRQGVEELVSAVAETGRPVDALALNAGVGNGGPFLETSLEADFGVIDLNVSAVVHLAKRLLPPMVARGAGRVLMTASTASTMPGPYYATYAASKAFVLSFAEAVRHELKDTGVTVTALMPGPTDTEFFERADMENTTVGQSSKDDPAKVAKQGFEGLMAGKHRVVVGPLAKGQSAMAAVLPEPVQAAVHGVMTRPKDD